MASNYRSSCGCVGCWGPLRSAQASPGSPPLPSLHFGFRLFVLGVGFARAYGLEGRERRAEAVRSRAEDARLAAQLSEALRQQITVQSSNQAETDQAETTRAVDIR